jgi:hypothetical protein
MRAKMALRSRPMIRIHINRIVRTRLHARLAPDAAIGIEIDNPVLALIHCRHRTNRDAGRLLAMIAPRDLKDPACIRKNALLNVLDPCMPRCRHDTRCTCGYQLQSRISSDGIVKPKNINHTWSADGAVISQKKSLRSGVNLNEGMVMNVVMNHRLNRSALFQFAL